MTSGMWSTALSVVYAVERGTSSTLDVVEVGTPFDVLAAVRVGQSWMEVVDSAQLFVSVRDLSRGEVVLRGEREFAWRPQRDALKQTLTISFGDDWKADDGDVLDVLATFKVTAGVHATYSTAQSGRLVATRTP